ncbi:hypothetical protein I317_01376 [Kwoniella heveanensis CBS 569]|nr:hypothetical protein I317_01376 [Kwoniella heveanensis CBS 569]
MGSNISSSSKKGATIINDEGYSSFIIASWTPEYDANESVSYAFCGKYVLYRVLVALLVVRVIPPSPVIDPQHPALIASDCGSSGDLALSTSIQQEEDTTDKPESNPDRVRCLGSDPINLTAIEAPTKTLGRDGYIQVEFYKEGQWSNAIIEQLENALSHAKLTRLYGRPRKPEPKRGG